MSRYHLLTINVSSQGLVSILTSIVSLQDPLQCLKSLFRVHSGRFLSYSKKKKKKKRKISQNNHSLSLVVIRYHSLSFVFTCCYWLSLVVSRCTNRCQSLYHSLLFVVTRCTTRFHSQSLNVLLVCLLINDFSK